jgi:hypothetical protein
MVRDQAGIRHAKSAQRRENEHYFQPENILLLFDSI